MKTVKSHLSSTTRAAFTLIELLVVMVVVAILAGLVLGTAGYVQKKGARSRAEAEIAAMSAALENYKADHGIYPRPKTLLDPSKLQANNPVNDPNYERVSRSLYQALSGDGDDAIEGGNVKSDGTRDSQRKQYMEFKPSMLGGLDAQKSVTSSVHVQDPFGASYGFYVPNPNRTPPAPVVYNPTFDLWSTGGTAKKAGESDEVFRRRWITNW